MATFTSVGLVACCTLVLAFSVESDVSVHESAYETPAGQAWCASASSTASQACDTFGGSSSLCNELRESVHRCGGSLGQGAATAEDDTTGVSRLGRGLLGTRRWKRRLKALSLKRRWRGKRKSATCPVKSFRANQNIVTNTNPPFSTCWPINLKKNRHNKYKFPTCNSKSELRSCRSSKKVSWSGNYFQVDENSGCVYCPPGTKPRSISHDTRESRRHFGKHAKQIMMDSSGRLNGDWVYCHKSWNGDKQFVILPVEDDALTFTKCGGFKLTAITPPSRGYDIGTLVSTIYGTGYMYCGIGFPCAAGQSTGYRYEVFCQFWKRTSCPRQVSGRMRCSTAKRLRLDRVYIEFSTQICGYGKYCVKTETFRTISSLPSHLQLKHSEVDFCSTLTQLH